MNFYSIPFIESEKRKMAVSSRALFNTLDDDQESGDSGNTGTMGIETIPSSLKTKHDRTFGRPASQMTVNETATAVVAAFTIVLSIAAIAIEGSFPVFVAGLFSMAMGLFSHYQQTQLNKVAEFSEKSENLVSDIARLKGENQRLTYFAEELEGRVEDLLDVEDALEIITKGDSMDALQNDADANLEAVCNLRQSVKTSAIETLVSFFYYRQEDPETDMDMPITKEETTKMIQKLHSIVGLSVDEDRLRKTVVGNSTDSIIDTLLNLLNDDLPAMSRIFQLKRRL